MATIESKNLGGLKLLCAGKYINLNLHHGDESVTPLIAAIKARDENIVKYLISELKADPNMEDGKEHKSPYFWAMKTNQAELADWLVKNGALIQRHDSMGLTMAYDSAKI